MLKVNAALGGEGMATSAKSARQIGKAAAAKEAKARIAAGRAAKAKGAQTAAGKARAALAKTSRTRPADKSANRDSRRAEPKTTDQGRTQDVGQGFDDQVGEQELPPKTTATKTAKKS